MVFSKSSIREKKPGVKPVPLMQYVLPLLATNPLDASYLSLFYEFCHSLLTVFVFAEDQNSLELEDCRESGLVGIYTSHG